MIWEKKIQHSTAKRAGIKASKTIKELSMMPCFKFASDSESHLATYEPSRHLPVDYYLPLLPMLRNTHCVT